MSTGGASLRNAGVIAFKLLPSKICSRAPDRHVVASRRYGATAGLDERPRNSTGGHASTSIGGRSAADERKITKSQELRNILIYLQRSFLHGKHRPLSGWPAR
jgi:hypothetical protein